MSSHVIITGTVTHRSNLLYATGLNNEPYFHMTITFYNDGDELSSSIDATVWGDDAPKFDGLINHCNTVDRSSFVTVTGELETGFGGARLTGTGIVKIEEPLV